MFERYNVLAGMLALGEFTTADLVKFACVKEATVKTVVHREKRLLAEIGEEKTGRPGGQLKRYRLEGDARDKLRAELEALYRDIPTRPSSGPEVASSTEIPLGVLAAEDALMRLLPREETPEKKKEILNLVQISLDSIRTEVRGALDAAGSDGEMTSVGARLQAVEALRDLGLADLEAEFGFQLDKPVDIAETFVRLTDATSVLRQRDEVEKAEEIARTMAKRYASLLHCRERVPALKAKLARIPGHRIRIFDKGDAFTRTVVNALRRAIEDEGVAIAEQVTLENQNRLWRRVSGVTMANESDCGEPIEATARGDVSSEGYTCILTVNSETADATGAFEDMRRHCPLARPVVLDVGYNAQLRNMVDSVARARYEGDARSLNPTTLRNILVSD